MVKDSEVIFIFVIFSIEFLFIYFFVFVFIYVVIYFIMFYKYFFCVLSWGYGVEFSVCFGGFIFYVGEKDF